MEESAVYGDPVTRELRGRWWRLVGILVVTALVLFPLEGTVSSALGIDALRAGLPPVQWLVGLRLSLTYALQPPSQYWFENSLMLAVGAVIVCTLLGAPAGYVLARARGRAISGYALVIFLLQSFPPVVLLVPLFLMFARVHLIDNLFGLGLVYLALTLSFAVWMFAAYVDTIPIELEEAAWMDGCSVLGGFFRVVLRNALPAMLTSAIFTFLTVWNEYMAAFIFLRSVNNYTLGVGLQAAGHSPTLAVLIALPPVLIFVLLNRYFSVGGVGGALAGR